MTIRRWILRRMKNIWDESRIENQNTHFMSNNFFSLSKIVPFMKQCRKIWWSQRDHKWRHNMAHTSCMLDKEDYMHSRACIRPRSQAHARAHTRTHKYVILFSFSWQQWLRERASMLHYTYTACLVIYSWNHLFSLRHVLFISMCTISRVNNPRWEV